MSMTERPILFGTPMVRRILADVDPKTQTRRVAKVPDYTPGRPLRHKAKHAGPYFDSYCSEAKTDVNPRGMSDRWCWWSADDRPDPTTEIRCPYGAPGDRLWVRETWQAWNCVSYERDEWDPITREVRMGEPWASWIDQRGKPDAIEYRATSKSVGPWTPSIHMPRWASRIDLEITAVRVERLHEITEDDARAEGADPMFVVDLADFVHKRAIPESTYRNGFGVLWREINGAASWDANPWVWAISFRRVRP